MTELVGKGMYIWQIPYCNDGNAAQIAGDAARAGLSHVVIKIADGCFGFGYDQNAVDLVALLARELHQVGIAVWGFHYVYGRQPADEARRAVKRALGLGLDGYVIDAEAEYKLAGAKAAEIYLAGLRNGMPKMPIALSSFRFPSLHPDFPWAPFLSGVDLLMPQVYWMGATNAGAQLTRSYTEYHALAPRLPYFPTGAAFHENGWTARPAEIIEFSGMAKSLGLPGANFWEWGNSQLYGLWDTVAGLDWGLSPSQPNPPLPEPASQPLRLRVTATQLNVRSGPGTNYPDVGDLYKGDIVQPLDVAGQHAWIQISATPERWICVGLGSVRFCEALHD